MCYVLELFSSTSFWILYLGNIITRTKDYPKCKIILFPSFEEVSLTAIKGEWVKTESSCFVLTWVYVEEATIRTFSRVNLKDLNNYLVGGLEIE